LLYTIATRNTVRRSQDYVKEEYEGLTTEQPTKWDTLDTPAVLRRSGKLVLSSLMSLRQQTSGIIMDALEAVQAKSVMEYGCGEGINIAICSQLHKETFPDLTWHGFEYSQGGTSRAQALVEALGLSNVSVWNGDGTDTQLEDNFVDLAYSAHVLEQMPDHWDKMVSEMKRTARFVLLIEPFYENKSLAGKTHSRANNYFRAKLSDLTDMGMDIMNVYCPDLQDPFNASTVVLLKSNGA
jgi:protein-L-isoaspartate O-methyltransferase